MKRKLLSILLCVAMLVTMLPTAAWAETTNSTVEKALVFSDIAPDAISLNSDYSGSISIGDGEDQYKYLYVETLTDGVLTSLEPLDATSVLELKYVTGWGEYASSDAGLTYQLQSGNYYKFHLDYAGSNDLQAGTGELVYEVILTSSNDVRPAAAKVNDLKRRLRFCDSELAAGTTVNANQLYHELVMKDGETKNPYLYIVSYKNDVLYAWTPVESTATINVNYVYDTTIPTEPDFREGNGMVVENISGNQFEFTYTKSDNAYLTDGEGCFFYNIQIPGYGNTIVNVAENSNSDSSTYSQLVISKTYLTDLTNLTVANAAFTPPYIYMKDGDELDVYLYIATYSNDMLTEVAEVPASESIRVRYEIFDGTTDFDLTDTGVVFTPITEGNYPHDYRITCDTSKSNNLKAGNGRFVYDVKLVNDQSVYNTSVIMDGYETRTMFSKTELNTDLSVAANLAAAEEALHGWFDMEDGETAPRYVYAATYGNGDLLKIRLVTDPSEIEIKYLIKEENNRPTFENPGTGMVKAAGSGTEANQIVFTYTKANGAYTKINEGTFRYDVSITNTGNAMINVPKPDAVIENKLVFTDRILEEVPETESLDTYIWDKYNIGNNETWLQYLYVATYTDGELTAVEPIDGNDSVTVSYLLTKNPDTYDTTDKGLVFEAANYGEAHGFNLTCSVDNSDNLKNGTGTFTYEVKLTNDTSVASAYVNINGYNMQTLFSDTMLTVDFDDAASITAAQQSLNPMIELQDDVTVGKYVYVAKYENYVMKNLTLVTDPDELSIRYIIGDGKNGAEYEEPATGLNLAEGTGTDEGKILFTFNREDGRYTANFEGMFHYEVRVGSSEMAHINLPPDERFAQIVFSDSTFTVGPVNITGEDARRFLGGPYIEDGKTLNKYVYRAEVEVRDNNYIIQNIGELGNVVFEYRYTTTDNGDQIPMISDLLLTATGTANQYTISYNKDDDDISARNDGFMGYFIQVSGDTYLRPGWVEIKEERPHAEWVFSDEAGLETLELTDDENCKFIKSNTRTYMELTEDVQIGRDIHLYRIVYSTSTSNSWQYMTHVEPVVVTDAMPLEVFYISEIDSNGNETHTPAQDIVFIPYEEEPGRFNMIYDPQGNDEIADRDGFTGYFIVQDGVVTHTTNNWSASIGLTDGLSQQLKFSSIELDLENMSTNEMEGYLSGNIEVESGIPVQKYMYVCQYRDIGNEEYELIEVCEPVNSNADFMAIYRDELGGESRYMPTAANNYGLVVTNVKDNLFEIKYTEGKESFAEHEEGYNLALWDAANDEPLPPWSTWINVRSGGRETTHQVFMFSDEPGLENLDLDNMQNRADAWNNLYRNIRLYDGVGMEFYVYVVGFDSSESDDISYMSYIDAVTVPAEEILVDYISEVNNGDEIWTFADGVDIEKIEDNLYSFTFNAGKDRFVEDEDYYQGYTAWVETEKYNNIYCADIEPVEVITGSCGPDATFKFYPRTREMYIEGTGSVWGYGNLMGCPVGPKTIYFGEGITSIDSEAFMYSGIEKVQFPDTLETIGERAFQHSDLVEVTIPASVTMVEKSAFEYCESLKKVTILGSLERKLYYPGLEGNEDGAYYEYSGAYIFRFCTSLENVDLSKSTMTTVFTDMFRGCTLLKTVKLPETLTTIRDAAFSYCSSLTEISIPENVNKIYRDAFQQCDNLTVVDLSKTKMETLHRYTFEYSKNLVSVKLPETVTTIEANTFLGCNEDLTLTVHKSSAAETAAKNAGLKYVYYSEMVVGNCGTGTPGLSYIFNPNTGEIWIEGYVEEGNYLDSSAFDSIRNQVKIYHIDANRTNVVPGVVPFPNLEAYVMDNENHGTDYYHYVKDGLLYEDGSRDSYMYDVLLKDIPDNYPVIDGTFTIPADVKGLHEASVLHGQRTIKKLIIPDTVKWIGSGSIFGEYAGVLEEIICKADVESLDVTFHNNSKLKTADLSEMKRLVTLNASFMGCSSLETVKLPACLQTITDGAFSYCTSLTNINIPSSVTTIGQFAFLGCSSLTRLVVPASVTNFGKGAFDECPNLTLVVVEDSAAHIYAVENDIPFILVGQKIMELESETVLAKTGETVEISFYITENPGVVSMNMKLDYDKDALELVGVANGNVFGRDALSYDENNLAQLTNLLWTNSLMTENVKDTGRLITLTFQVKDTAAEGKYTVKLVSDDEFGGAVDKDSNKVTVMNGEGIIDARNYTIGDMTNGNGITVMDAMYMKYYLARYTGFTDLDTRPGDVDQDEDLDLRDLMILERHLAKWRGYETLPLADSVLPS